MIYKLRADRNHFLMGYLSTEEIERVIGDYFLLDEPLWAAFWKPINIVFQDDSDSQSIITPPDVTVWGTSNNLICNEKAYKALVQPLANFGEWLPLTCENKPYWLFHSTKKTLLDCVDVTLSQRTIDATGYTEAQKIVFKPNALDDLLVFQTEYTFYANLYATEKFKALVAQSDLKGLRFSDDMSNGPF